MVKKPQLIMQANELCVEWLKEYHKIYNFRFGLKNGKRTPLRGIKDFKEHDFYIVFGEKFDTSLITLDKEISTNGTKVNGLHFDKIETVEVYFKESL